jgi:hypothetical protein
MDVSAQLEQRADRTHGTSLDALLWRAEEGDLEPKKTPRKRTRTGSKTRDFREMARPGLEPGTPRFSGDDP